MLEFLQENIYKLMFTGSAAIVIGVIAQRVSSKKKNGEKEKGQEEPSLVISPSNSGNTETVISPVFNFTSQDPLIKPLSRMDNDGSGQSLERRKALTKIIFIDDDTKFRVVQILKKSGWINIKAIKDIKNIDDLVIRDADIVFVDIQGVGKALDCKDEGLGLALNLKQKYPSKKIVIYSAENTGDRFHEALRKADSFLPKNAEPLEFQSLVEQYSKEIYPND
ncbi:response regulator transcription factor [Chitinophaga agri]|uniref:Response regulator transcription factor n=1 Tax=Chitinophaga agri TaxID=2703787 RepID=A0A6B9ZF14_9BACT|nr:response regulator transcription factor [Chitinophaga agri]QHS59914.1 response regulator transcription factor [Chitinophaga agri]